MPKLVPDVVEKVNQDEKKDDKIEGEKKEDN